MTELLLNNKESMFNDKLNHSMIENIMADSQKLNDYLVPQHRISVSYNLTSSKPRMNVPINQYREVKSMNIHTNAITQLGDKIGVPANYLKNLSEGQDWQKSLFSRTLNDHFSFLERQNPVLLRTNDYAVKAYLSNSYDRYNSVEVLGQFLTSFYNNGLELSQAYFDGIRYFVELTSKNNPIMIDNQLHFFAVQFRNSDYGRGALDIRFMLIKQICSNGMVMQSALRKIHRGRKMELPGDNFMLSEDTMKKETAAKKGIVRDVANYICSEKCVNDIISRYQKANDIEIEVSDVIEKLPSVGATKKDIDLIQNILMGNKAETGVQEGGNIVRVASAVSYIANRYDNTEAESINKYREMSGNLLMKFVK